MLDTNCHCHFKSETTAEHFDQKIVPNSLSVHTYMSSSWLTVCTQGFKTVINWGEGRVGIYTAAKGLPNPEDNGNYQ